MMCDRCDQPIAPGQDERVPMPGASGAGVTLVLHRGGCKIARAHPVSYPQERRIIDFDQPDPDLGCQRCRQPPVVAASFTGARWEYICAACAGTERRRGEPPRPYSVS
ncbi:hypothetical protein [Streptomyces bacillaris]|uniref:hypothetical protein n=1 Tax=Streptomyces bacillaris TaxID=68179 RepID=UPI00365AFF91